MVQDGHILSNGRVYSVIITYLQTYKTLNDNPLITIKNDCRSTDFPILVQVSNTTRKQL